MSSSVYTVTFPTAATAAFVQASDDRERHASAESLQVFFEPSSIAVIGASPKPGSVGRTIVANLRRRGYRGPIYPVHPTAQEIEGLACVSSLTGAAGHVDLAILAVPALSVEKLTEECGRAGVRGVIVISAEVADEGHATRAQLRRVVRTAGMRMLGPASLGVLRTAATGPLDAIVPSSWPIAGGVSLFCEGAAQGVALLERAVESGLGIADFVSAGDKADVSGNDLLSYWSGQPSTKVIALCLESLGNPRRFARIARAVALLKPVVVLTSSTSSDVADVLAEARVQRARTTDELFDILGRVTG